MAVIPGTPYKSHLKCLVTGITQTSIPILTRPLDYVLGESILAVGAGRAVNGRTQCPVLQEPHPTRHRIRLLPRFR